ncbi:FG-GAP-like repeat-containing protein [Fulvivirgaceae bacterium BMA10]|uniref:FG-GAP-like repeat-containing protein n=1 Tax=Splendidivirga corallicola TaxID=3051826 RepID=A0ABT8KVR7_9BACT|nr:FG-GAP-like repeat-containing protein [Fulvivirgaceae bacterium BMA10]
MITIDVKKIALTILFLLTKQFSTAQGFSNVSDEAGIKHTYQDIHTMGGGLAFFDYNNDGYEDLYLTGGTDSDKLYKNNGDGTFTNVFSEVGLSKVADFFTRGVIAGDINNDGYKDLFVTTDDGFSNLLLLNNADGIFENISEAAGITEKAWSTSASFGDYNKDGLLDIYVCNYVEYGEDLPFDTNIERTIPNFLYENQGNNKFINRASSCGVLDRGAGLAVAFTDVNADHNPDILIANDFGDTYAPNALFMNNSDNTFTNKAQQAKMNYGINGMGVAIGDYDKDGDFDYYITNMADNLLHNKNDDILGFREMSSGAKVGVPDLTSWGTAFFDYDHDSNLDLLVVNGNLVPAPIPESTLLFKGTGENSFSDVSVDQNITNSHGRGLAIGDYDNDGDIDFAISVIPENADDKDLLTGAILQQNNNDYNGNWLKVKLEGVYSNKNGIGSKLKLYVNNQLLMREIDGGSSYMSHNSTIAHFGLGDVQHMDSLEVYWTGGTRQVIYNINPNQTLTIKEEKPRLSIFNYSICEGDSLLILGEYQKRPSVYYDSLKNGQGNLYEIIETHLTVEPVKRDTTYITLASGEKFQGNMILNDTIIVETNTPDGHCSEQVYNINVKNKLVTALNNNATFNKKYEILINPNPVSSHTIEIEYYLSAITNVRISLFNYNGKHLRTLNIQNDQIGEQQNTLYVGDLKPGIYFGRLIYKNETEYTNTHFKILIK